MRGNREKVIEQPVLESTITLQQRAYDLIKARIMNLELKPGQYITDSEVASEIGISRTPVREGLRRLEHEGLLINQARRGWKVYALSLEDIHDIFDVKEAVEGMLARRAAECSDEQAQSALAQAIEQMQHAVGTNDVEAWLKADVQLHDTIFAMSGNERAASIIQNINDQWHRVRIGFVALQERIQRSSPEHKAIVESILAGDGEEAERLMTVHLHNVREELVHLLVNLVLPFVEQGI